MNDLLLDSLKRLSVCVNGMNNLSLNPVCLSMQTGWTISHSAHWSLCLCKRDEWFIAWPTEAFVVSLCKWDERFIARPAEASIYVNGMNNLSLIPLKPLSVSVNGMTDWSLNPLKPVCLCKMGWMSHHSTHWSLCLCKWNKWFISRPGEASM